MSPTHSNVDPLFLVISIMDQFLGRFGHERSENFDAYLRAKGVGWFTRWLIQSTTITKHFCKLQDGRYSLTNEGGRKPLTWTFALDESFEDYGLDGKRHRIKFWLESDTLLESHVRIEAHDDHEEIYRYSRESDYLVLAFHYIMTLVIDTGNPLELVAHLKSPASRHLVHTVFENLHKFAQSECRLYGLCGRHFFNVSESLLASITQPIVCFLTTEERRTLLKGFFLDGPLLDCVLVLAKNIGLPNNFTANLVMDMLSIFIKKGKLRCLLSQLICDVRTADDCSLFDYKLLWQLLASVPERIANRWKGNSSTDFRPSSYFRSLTICISQTLNDVHSAIVAEKNCAITPLSLLLEKLIATGNASAVLDLLVPYFVQKADCDFIWRRVSQRLFVSMSKASLELVIIGIAEKAMNGTAISLLLGSNAVEDPSVCFLLTNKFLLLRYFPRQSRTMHNIIDYLASSVQVQLLEQTATKLLEVWGNRQNILHMPHEQRVYISAAIVLIVKALCARKPEHDWHNLRTLLVQGTSEHLSSPLEQSRKIGMVLSEILIDYITPLRNVDASEERLKFEYVDDDDTIYVKALLKNSKDADHCVEFADTLFSKINVDSFSIDVEHGEEQTNAEDTVNDDSDEELLIDQLSIAPEQKIKLVEEQEVIGQELHFTLEKIPNAPVYLGDAMDGLFEQSNWRKFEVCLKALEQLIRKNALGLQDRAEELLKALLHLENRFSLPDFEEKRLSCMIACCVMCPEKCSSFIAKQFYMRNYNLQQRLDILKVVREASFELSGYSKNNIPNSDAAALDAAQKCGPSPKTQELWQLIVAERLAKKTRHFNSRVFVGTEQKQDLTTINKLLPYAGELFFLMLSNYDRPEDHCFDILDKDSHLLGQLLYTLSSLLYYSQNSPSVMRMAKALAELVWSLRFHEEAFVRQGLLFALSKIIISLKPSLLLSELETEIYDCKEWLEYVVTTDANQTCKRFAQFVLALLQSHCADALNSNLFL